ncbi:MarR family winged helix-turn-helix transcriptional regulator [Jannaschia sp. R86511]|uniref:MarR family winged helix-turn-helix transcriptional regulator n=1 Tax=Jannaschia sp. R86511 TaxID=3093853 RepID=UPI0036D36A90
MTDAVERNAAAMREFQARAVLFQDAVARSAGLNSTDLQAVGLLMSEGPATPGELAARTGLTAGGSITALIDRLERAGYVVRRRDGADRRRVLVSVVTERVLADVGPVYGRIAGRWADYLATLTTEQVELATEVLTRAAEINREEVERMRSR